MKKPQITKPLVYLSDISKGMTTTLYNHAKDVIKIREKLIIYKNGRKGLIPTARGHIPFNEYELDYLIKILGEIETQ
jgi:hypothetical protein